MSRNAILAGLTVLCLAAGHVAAQDERPRFYENLPAVGVEDQLVKQGVSYRLPNDTFPIRYDISLTTRIDLGEFDFTGNVIIHLKVKNVTSMITIHSKLLTINEIKLNHGTTNAVIGVTHTLDEPLEFLKIATATPLTVDQVYVLEISYNGTLRIDNGGFYRSSYVNEAGRTT